MLSATYKCPYNPYKSHIGVNLDELMDLFANKNMTNSFFFCMNLLEVWLRADNRMCWIQGYGAIKKGHLTFGSV